MLALCNKCRGFIYREGFVCSEIIYIHIPAIIQLIFKILPHPPNNRDIAPSDCHIFGPLKEAFHGRRFASEDEVKDAVHMWLQSLSKKLSFHIMSQSLQIATQD